jgi:hypothetical protein
MRGHVHKTLAVFLLCGAAGCASGPFHRKTAQAPAPPPPPPELSQTPLYSPEMSDGSPKVPSLPATAAPVVKAPEPAVQKTHKTHKPKPPAATAKTNPPAAAPAAGSSSPTTAAATNPAVAAEAPSAASPTADKKPTDTQQAATAAPAASPIGELTAGDSAEAAQTSRQAEDLIKTTKNGVDSIKRDLTPDEKKTVEQIRTFLKRAEQALQNSDVDGAYGLATKAKLLLDELTPK